MRIVLIKIVKINVKMMIGIFMIMIALETIICNGYCRLRHRRHCHFERSLIDDIVFLPLERENVGTPILIYLANKIMSQTIYFEIRFAASIKSNGAHVDIPMCKIAYASIVSFI